jgi:hypothetical protein
MDDIPADCLTAASSPPIPRRESHSPVHRTIDVEPHSMQRRRMEVPIKQAQRVRAYQRLTIGISIAGGIAVGVGLGGLAVLVRSPFPILILAIPLGVRLFGSVSGRITFPDRAIAWLWPIIALVVAVAMAVLLPASLAPFGLGLGVALWFTTLVAGGILDVVVDPEGRLGP